MWYELLKEEKGIGEDGEVAEGGVVGKGVKVKARLRRSDLYRAKIWSGIAI